MATKAASKRLGKEAQLMEKDPPPYCFARPREDNVLEWHFILRGPPDTPFYGGEYWGQLLFPSDYPFKPPGIKVSTPSGRFHIDSKICTSMSDFHPGSWNPAWSVANILVGLLSFMCSDEMTTGSIMATPADRGILATRSHAFNISQPKFRKMFPDYSKEKQIDLPNMGEMKKAASLEGSSTSSKSQSQQSFTASASAKVVPSIEADTSGTTGTKENSLVSAGTKERSSTITAAPPMLLPQGIQAPGQGQVQDQARSKAFLPLLIALLAYLFLSRVASTLSGSPSSS